MALTIQGPFFAARVLWLFTFLLNEMPSSDSLFSVIGVVSVLSRISNLKIEFWPSYGTRQFSVSGITLAVCPYLDLGSWVVASNFRKKQKSSKK